MKPKYTISIEAQHKKLRPKIAKIQELQKEQQTSPKFLKSIQKMIDGATQHTGTTKGIIKFDIRYPLEYLEKTPNGKTHKHEAANYMT